MFDLGGFISKIANDVGVAEPLRERLALAKDKADMLAEQVRTLQERNSHLEKRIVDLESQIQAQTIPKEFTEFKGVLFRKLPKGGYELGVYCPVCHIPMVSM